MQKTKSFMLLMAAVAIVATFTSCQKPGGGDEPKEKDVHHYVYIAHAGKSFHLTSFGDFTEGTVSTYENAITLPTGHAFLEKYGKYVYVMVGNMMGTGGEQKLYKYSLSEKGRLSDKPEAVLSFANSPNVVDIVFASETKAYGVTSGGQGNIIIFNPTEMKETGAIDISSYAKGVVKDEKGNEYPDHDPDAGKGIIRDGKLYLPFTQMNGRALADAPATVAIIDIATDKVEKVITDDRANGLGMVGHSEPVMDEAGNIYFYTGPLAAMMGAMGMPCKDGLLRIKKGETEFDKDFYMSLQSVPGAEKGSYGMYMIYGGEGKVYIFLNIPSKMVNNDVSDDANKPFVPYEVDLFNQTAKALPLPASTGWAANAIIKVGDVIYFGEQTVNGTGFFGYNTKTGKSDQKPVVTTPTGAYKIIRGI